MKMPHSPFATRLSGSAKETELRLRNIFQWKKKRPPVALLILAALVVLLCGNMVGFATSNSDESAQNKVEDTEQKQDKSASDESTQNKMEDNEQKQDESAISPVEPLFVVQPGLYVENFSDEADVEEFQSWVAKYAAAHPEEYNSFDAEEYFKKTFSNPIQQFLEPPGYDLEEYLKPHPLQEGETVDDRMRSHWLISIWQQERDRAAVEAAGYFDFSTPYWKMSSYDSLKRFFSTNDMTLEEYGQMVTWMQDYLAQHPQEEAAFDADAYYQENLTYPPGADMKMNWFSNRPMDYSEEDFKLEIKALWLKSLYDGWKETAQATDATQEVLDYVDAFFASGDPNLQCFLLPATGPIRAPMNEYYQEVRSLFAQRTWVRQDGPAPKREPYPDGWTMYLTSSGGITIDAGANSAWITVLSSGESITYRTANDANDLVRSLVNLWDGPDFRYALVTLPETITDDNALAQAYTDAFRELYLNSGAIADYELRSLEVLPRADVRDMEPSFQMTYAVKPADPDDPSWRYYPQAENGWVTCSVEIHLTLAGDDSQEEMVWRCGGLE